MKRLAILAGFTSSSIFAGVTKFDEPKFLKLAEGNPKIAHELFAYCSANSSNKDDCIKELEGAGNLKQEAARKCMQQSVNSLINLSNYMLDPVELAKRGGLLGGVTYPTNKPHRDSDGTHIHKYTNSDLDLAEARYYNFLLDNSLKKSEANRVVESKTSEMSFGGALGVSAIVTVEFQPTATNSTTRTGGKLFKHEYDEVVRKAKEARDNPYTLTGTIPSMLCFVWEKECTVGTKSVPNPYYNPKAKDDSDNAKESGSKSDKKETTENPPKHEDDSVADVPNLESTEGGDIWASNDTTPIDTMIATPMERDETQRTAMDSCVEKETDFLIKQIGSGTVDPNGTLSKKEEDERAKSLLQFGYCDVGVMGRDFCAQKKFKESSKAAVDIKEERKEKAEKGSHKLNSTGVCDPQLLGAETCKKHREKWIKTPKGTNPSFLDEKSVLDGVKLPKPAKPSDTPRVMD